MIRCCRAAGLLDEYEAESLACLSVWLVGWWVSRARWFVGSLVVYSLATILLGWLSEWMNNAYWFRLILFCFVKVILLDLYYINVRSCLHIFKTLISYCCILISYCFDWPCPLSINAMYIGNMTYVGKQFLDNTKFFSSFFLFFSNLSFGVEMFVFVLLFLFSPTVMEFTLKINWSILTRNNANSLFLLSLYLFGCGSFSLLAFPLD